MDREPKTIAIYSVGLLGGSLGLGLKASGYAGRIVGLSSPATIEAALSLQAIDEGHGYDKLPSVVASADLLILCSPIHAILETIGRLGACALPAGIVITDVGSTKQAITAAARKALPAGTIFIGGHPMAGAERSGVHAADPYLFQNAFYVLTVDGTRPSDEHHRLAAFLTRYLGCKHVFLDPATHDLIAAAVSHLPHVLAVELVNLTADVENQTPGALELAAGGFRDMTRIASAPYSLWRDILSTNSDQVTALLDRLIGRLRAASAELGRDGLQGDFDRANETRRRIPARNKGFIRPLSEVLVQAKDQPGVIADLAAHLARDGINIKDIEVLKVREGEGGTIRLAFDNATIARSAIRILNGAGFTARERD